MYIDFPSVWRYFREYIVASGGNSTYKAMYAYKTLKVEIPWQLVEERPDVLDLAVRMRLAVVGISNN